VKVASGRSLLRSRANNSQMAPRGWALLPVAFAIDAPETGSNAGSSALTNPMNKPDGGDFAHISRSFQRRYRSRGKPEADAAPPISMATPKRRRPPGSPTTRVGSR
jgi:hypothetical protein